MTASENERLHGLDYEPEPSEIAMREAASFLRIACLGTDVCAEYNKRCVCALRLARLIELHAAAQKEQDAQKVDDMASNCRHSAAEGILIELAAAIRSAPRAKGGVADDWLERKAREAVSKLPPFSQRTNHNDREAAKIIRTAMEEAATLERAASENERLHADLANYAHTIGRLNYQIEQLRKELELVSK